MNPTRQPDLGTPASKTEQLVDIEIEGPARAR